MTSYNNLDLTGRPQTGSGQPVAPFSTPARWDPSQSQVVSSASSYADLNYLFGVQDPTMIAPKSNRNRRKSSQGPDHTKHRRTRSGCYTCRSRRVKVIHSQELPLKFLLTKTYSATKLTLFAKVRPSSRRLIGVNLILSRVQKGWP